MVRVRVRVRVRERPLSAFGEGGWSGGVLGSALGSRAGGDSMVRASLRLQTCRVQGRVEFS